MRNFPTGCRRKDLAKPLLVLVRKFVEGLEERICFSCALRFSCDQSNVGARKVRLNITPALVGHELTLSSSASAALRPGRHYPLPRPGSLIRLNLFDFWA